jgi:hypothetical protein
MTNLFKALERTYEYAIAEMDEYGDIQDYAFTDTYHEALACAALIDGNSMIELWVNFGNDDIGLSRNFGNDDIGLSRNFGNDDIGLSRRDMYEIVHGALQGEYPKHVEKHFEKTRA